MVCDDYTAGPFTDPGKAGAWLASVQELGACHLPHIRKFETPVGVQVRFVKQYTIWTGRQFRRYEQTDTGRTTDVLIRLGREAGYRMLLSNLEAKAQATLMLAG